MTTTTKTLDQIKSEFDAALAKLRDAHIFQVEAEFPDKRGTKRLTVPQAAGWSGVTFAVASAYANGATAVRALVVFPDPRETRRTLERLAEEVKAVQGTAESVPDETPELPSNVTPITKARKNLH